MPNVVLAEERHLTAAAVTISPVTTTGIQGGVSPAFLAHILPTASVSGTYSHGLRKAYWKL